MENLLEIIKKIAVPLFLLFLLIGIVIGVVNFQKNRKAPEVTITEPKEAIITEASELVVTGTTNNPENTVNVNGNPADVSEDGSFQYKLTLIEGENPIDVEAISKGGKSTATSTNITRLAAKPTAPAPVPNGGGGKEGGQDREVLDGGTGKGATGSAEAPLSTAGPKENVIAIVWILGIFLYYYHRSRIMLAESMKKV
ncbi:hypothetical protein COY62_01105 [bacterium (Candidatus Howlettbacteria) CG_4_10_14_0_8_um_filter_40_9]|nr:MAG: hypothetical protein COY62_01105 [bacterium (Candidatus Howlettbacteria) CG_4_10_14_0_8_um_filter_40_9]